MGGNIKMLVVAQQNIQVRSLPRSLDDKSIASVETGLGLLAFVPTIEDTMAAMLLVVRGL